MAWGGWLGVETPGEELSVTTAPVPGRSQGFCLTAGDFPGRPFEDPFNPLTDSVLVVAFFGLLRRQKL